MTYRYRPPVLLLGPGDGEREAPAPEASDVVFRRAAMLARYAAMFREISAAFEKAPAGIWQRMQELAPTVARTIDDTEQQADDMALAYVGGLVQVDDFERALAAHRAAWVRALDIGTRATPPFPEHEPCAGCGSAAGFTVAVRDDQGTLRCRRCLAGDHQDRRDE